MTMAKIVSKDTSRNSKYYFTNNFLNGVKGKFALYGALILAASGVMTFLNGKSNNDKNNRRK